MTPNENLTAMLAAIDDGDDSILPILGDLLESIGDPRAKGLRDIIRLGKSPSTFYTSRHAVWHCEAYYAAPLHPLNKKRCVTQKVFDRLPGRIPLHPNAGANYLAEYPTRSAAYMALAEALTGLE